MTDPNTSAEPWVLDSFPAEWHFTRLPNEILVDPTLSADAKIVWMLLCHLAYEQRAEVIVSGVPEARGMVGLTERAWMKARKELEARGMVAVRRRGHGLPNLYTVSLPLRIAESSNDDSDASADAAIPQEPSFRDLVDTDVSNETSGWAPPKVTKLDGRDVAWDKLVEVCGIAARSPRLGDVATALNGSSRSARYPGIRRLFWQEVIVEADRRGVPRPEGGEQYERALAAAIEQRAALYRRTMGDAMLTPTALAKWWTDVPNMRRSGGLTAEEIFAQARADKEAGR